MASLKTVSVPKKDAKGKDIQNKDGSFEMETVLERFQVETWVANGHAGVEPKMYAYVCVCRPAADGFPEQRHPKVVDFTPSSELAALMHKEIMAAVGK